MISDRARALGALPGGAAPHAAHLGHLGLGHEHRAAVAPTAWAAAAGASAARTPRPTGASRGNTAVGQARRPLWVWPTGLADGLAPESRYGRDNPADSPPRRTLFEPLEWFPRSPGDRFASEIRQAVSRRGSITAGSARARPWRVPHFDPVGAASACADILRFMKTYVATPASRERNWLVVDATGQTLGRLATQIADALRGKRKPEYTPHCDIGDFVIVVNAEKISVTGRKREQKRYYRHSGYPGGLRSRTLAEMLERRPEEVIRHAVKGMLPRNRLGRAQLRKLKVYAGPDHPHAAQTPEQMEVQA